MPEGLQEAFIQLHNPLCEAALLKAQQAALAFAYEVSQLVHDVRKDIKGLGPIRAVGVHGQTILHRPELGISLQLNAPAVIAEQTGLVVVSDFRTADLAAEEMRTIMAQLGFRTVDEMVGQSQKLNMNAAIDHFKAQGIDLSAILYKPEVAENVPVRNITKQDHGLDNVLDVDIVSKAQKAIISKEPQTLHFDIKNTNRSVGALLSNEISKAHGREGLPTDTLKLLFKGAAGQSFGCFATKGLHMEVTGNANDYFGKGLSGARLVAKVPEEATFKPEENIIIGNVALYGATAGEAYINGIAGERFCVRNSGAVAVVEGVGDHGCEYMTGGEAVILGKIGRNFAAGMSGGIAYIYAENGVFDDRNFNMEMIGLEDLSKDDIAHVKELIQNHISYTGSPLATQILADWNTTQKHFIKVMPTDYKAALERMAQEKQNA